MKTVLYETLFALDITKVTVDVEAAKLQLHHLIEKYGGEIVVARSWDENGKLAYPIQKQKKAFFYIIYYRFESIKHSELEVDYKISENILRYLTSKIEPKNEETMLEIARNEQGNRFAFKAMKDDGAPTGEGIVSNDPLARGEYADLPSLNPISGPEPGKRRRKPADEKPD